MGTIVPIGTIEFIEIVLKKSHIGSLRASFCFVHTKKVAPRCDSKSAKGHQMQCGIFYFESCICQKKRTKNTFTTHPKYNKIQTKEENQ